MSRGVVWMDEKAYPIRRIYLDEGLIKVECDYYGEVDIKRGLTDVHIHDPQGQLVFTCHIQMPAVKGNGSLHATVVFPISLEERE